VREGAREQQDRESVEPERHDQRRQPSWLRAASLIDRV
jgi:hypothetical protein